MDLEVQMQVLSLQKSKLSIALDDFALVAPHGIFRWKSTQAINESSSLTELLKYYQLQHRVVDDDLSIFIGKKGLRFFDRSSKLMLAAVKLCLMGTESSNQQTDRENTSLIVGSDGALASQYAVTANAINQPHLMNPNNYPNRGCNVIAGQVSLKCGFRGESTVVSSGYRSGIDALICGVRKCYLYGGQFVVAAGESLSDARQLRHQWYHQNSQIPMIEGAVAFLILPNNKKKGTFLTVVGYQQCHADISKHTNIKHQFLTSLAWDKILVDLTIDGVDGHVEIFSPTMNLSTPFDAFGATSVMLLAIMLIQLAHSNKKDNYKLVIHHSSFDGTLSSIALEITCGI